MSTHIVSTGVPIERFGSAELKSRYLPRICAGDLIGAYAITERQGGSDAAAMRTTAVARDDGFVLNGEKCFISSGPVADLVVVYARTSAGSGPFGITAFAVERSTPGFEVGPPIAVLRPARAELADGELRAVPAPRRRPHRPPVARCVRAVRSVGGDQVAALAKAVARGLEGAEADVR